MPEASPLSRSTRGWKNSSNSCASIACCSSVRRREALEDARVHGLLEDAVPALAVPLAHVHRRVGVAHQVVRGDDRDVGVRHGDGDAEARAHDELLRLEADRRGERRDDAIGQVRDGLQARECPRAAPRTRRRRSARPYRSRESCRRGGADLTQHLVARGMAEAVVDGLEVVEVEEDHADRLVSAIDTRSARAARGRRRARGWRARSRGRGRPGARSAPRRPSARTRRARSGRRRARARRRRDRSRAPRSRSSGRPRARAGTRRCASLHRPASGTRAPARGDRDRLRRAASRTDLPCTSSAV